MIGTMPIFNVATAVVTLTTAVAFLLSCSIPLSEWATIGLVVADSVVKEQSELSQQSAWSCRPAGRDSLAWQIDRGRPEADCGARGQKPSASSAVRARSATRSWRAHCSLRLSWPASGRPALMASSQAKKCRTPDSSLLTPSNTAGQLVAADAFQHESPRTVDKWTSSTRATSRDAEESYPGNLISSRMTPLRRGSAHPSPLLQGPRSNCCNVRRCPTKKTRSKCSASILGCRDGVGRWCRRYVRGLRSFALSCSFARFQQLLAARRSAIVVLLLGSLGLRRARIGRRLVLRFCSEVEFVASGVQLPNPENASACHTLQCSLTITRPFGKLLLRASQALVEESIPFAGRTILPPRFLIGLLLLDHRLRNPVPC